MAAAVKNTKVSTTDPESGFMHRNNKPQGFFWPDHRTVDGKHGIITDTHARPGNVHDSQPFITRLTRQINRCGLETVAAGVDVGYFTAAVCHLTQQMGTPLVPGYRRPGKGQNDDQKKHLHDDPGRDTDVCPAESEMIYRTTDRNGYRHYRSGAKVCAGCPLRSRCTQSRKMQKTVMRHMGRRARKSQCAAADETGQKGLCTAKVNGGTELRGCQTTLWSPACAVPGSDEGNRCSACWRQESMYGQENAVTERY